MTAPTKQMSLIFVDLNQESGDTHSMLTPEQSRAARGWLGWTQQTLARRASVGLSTVRDFENGRRWPIANNLAAMRLAMEQAGVKFVFDDGHASGIGVAPELRPAETLQRRKRVLDEPRDVPNNE